MSLFVRVRITNEGSDYPCQAWMSSCVQAETNTFARKVRMVGPEDQIAYQAAVIFERLSSMWAFTKRLIPSEQISKHR